VDRRPPSALFGRLASVGVGSGGEAAERLDAYLHQCGGREDLHLEVDRQFGQHFPRDVIDLHSWPEQRQA